MHNAVIGFVNTVIVAFIKTATTKVKILCYDYKNGCYIWAICMLYIEWLLYSCYACAICMQTAMSFQALLDLCIAHSEFLVYRNICSVAA